MIMTMILIRHLALNSYVFIFVSIQLDVNNYVEKIIYVKQLTNLIEFDNHVLALIEKFNMLK